MSEANDTCKWWDEDGCWASDCGVLFEFTVDGPTQNGFNYCYKCGKRIEVEIQTEVDE